MVWILIEVYFVCGGFDVCDRQLWFSLLGLT